MISEALSLFRRHFELFEEVVLPNVVFGLLLFLGVVVGLPIVVVQLLQLPVEPLALQLGWVVRLLGLFVVHGEGHLTLLGQWLLLCGLLFDYLPLTLLVYSDIVLFVGDVSTRQTRRLDSHNAVRPLLAFDWTAEGDRLLLARADQQLQVVRFPDGKLERSLPVHRRSLQTLTLSPSRDRFLTLDVHRAISLWDTRDVAPRDASGRATAEGSRENRSRD